MIRRACTSRSGSKVRAACRLSARRAAGVLVLASALAGCGHDSTGPANADVRLAVAAGTGQFVPPGLVAELPLTAQVTRSDDGKPVSDTDVEWRIVAGSGAALLGATRSDVIGMASVQLRAGPDTGTIRVEARASRLVGPPASFDVRVVRPPTIAAVTPTTAAAGTDVTIAGTGFSAVAAENSVLFGGLRAIVRSATATAIVAGVPRCVLDRDTDVRVSLGSVASNAITVRTTGGTATTVQLARGESARFDAPTDLACLDLSDAPAGAEYLVVAGDVSRLRGLPLRFELLGIAGGVPTALPGPAVPSPTGDVASRWELGLRGRERTFGPPLAVEGGITAQSAAEIPAIGDSREFNVLEPDQKTTRKARATVRAISERAIIYVADDAPSGGFSTADLQNFGAVFDDPIYATDIATFGTPSDIDQNGRIIILFTPAVNALTARGENGFIAGYFYGCDLVSADRCKSTNQGEIFYAVVPDPTAKFGDPRAKSTVLRTVPGVLAHEFQHMISFARRNGSLNVVWLSEGLAHAAEDIVGEVFAARGDTQMAEDFRHSNFVRAQLYLRAIESTSRIDLESPGSLEMRGGAWLFVKYLTGQFGGASLLDRLTGSALNGAASVEAVAGRSWESIASDFAVALYADGAPELAAVSVDPRLSILDLDLRAAFSTLSGGFPALAPTVNFGDFLLSGTLASASQTYAILRAPPGSTRFRLAYTGPRGAELATGSAALSLLRLR